MKRHILDIPIDEQISEINRELNLRKRLYPQWIREAKIVNNLADDRIAILEAVLRTLEEVERKNAPQGQLFEVLK